MEGDCCPVINPIVVFEEQQIRIEKLKASNARLASENLALVKKNHDLEEAIELRNSFADVVE